MKFAKPVLVAFAIFASGWSSADAQKIVRRTADGSSEGVFVVQEVQTVITSARDTITVLDVLPKELRPEGYSEIELMKSDQILMLNAKRVKTVKAFEDGYGELAIGDEVKLGVRRKGELLIVSFKKIDPEKLPKGRKMMISLDGDGSEDIRPLFGTGLILGFAKNQIKVMEKMEEHTPALGGADIQKGDVIESINGKKVENLDQLFEIYDKLAVGDKVEAGYARGDKKMQLSFVKPEARGRMIFKQD